MPTMESFNFGEGVKPRKGLHVLGLGVGRAFEQPTRGRVRQAR